MRDFIRVYTPAGAKLTGGSGFDQTYHEDPACRDATSDDCTLPDNLPSCAKTVSNPHGGFIPGHWPLPVGYREGSIENVIDAIGKPTLDTTMDEKELTTFGGLAVIPQFCNATLTMEWTVKDVAAGSGYTFLAQSQSDAFINLTVNITNTQGATSTFHVNPLVTDQKWTVSTGR
jgi:hypothetical protein